MTLGFAWNASTPSYYVNVWRDANDPPDPYPVEYAIFSTYSMRQATVESTDGSAMRLDEFAGSGITSDSLFNIADNFAAQPDGIEKLFWFNHVHSWNVLFTDGSVKTFADAAHSIIRMQAMFVTDKPTWVEARISGSRIVAGGTGTGWWNQVPGTWLNVHVWTPLFDPLYTMD